MAFRKTETGIEVTATVEQVTNSFSIAEINEELSRLNQILANWPAWATKKKGAFAARRDVLQQMKDYYETQ